MPVDKHKAVCRVHPFIAIAAFPVEAHAIYEL